MDSATFTYDEHPLQVGTDRWAVRFHPDGLRPVDLPSCHSAVGAPGLSDEALAKLGGPSLPRSANIGFVFNG